MSGPYRDRQRERRSQLAYGCGMLLAALFILFAVYGFIVFCLIMVPR